jgi:hypothetical protein
MKFFPVVCGRPTWRLWSHHAVVMLQDGQPGGPLIIFPQSCFLRKGWNETCCALCHCVDVASVLLPSRSGGCVGCFGGGTLLICQVVIFVATRFLHPIGVGSSG